MGFDNWMTPPSEIELARAYMGGISIDPASNLVAQEYVKADRFAISPTEASQYNSGILPYNTYIDGLRINWHGNVWLNPPYSAGLIDEFADKAVHEWREGNIERMLILVNSQTDTRWYHKLADKATRIFIYRGRLKFWKIFNGPEGYKAYPKWEGEVSIKRREENPNEKAKIGNQPRYLNTLFLFESDGKRLDKFRDMYRERGTILMPERY